MTGHNTPPFAAVLRRWKELKPFAAASPAPQELAQVHRDVLRPHSHDGGTHSGYGMESIVERLQKQ